MIKSANTLYAVGRSGFDDDSILKGLENFSNRLREFLPVFDIDSRYKFFLHLLAETGGKEAAGSMSESDWADLAELAMSLNLAGLLYDRIRQKEIEDLVPDPVCRMLRQQYLSQAAMGALILRQLKTILNAFKARDIPVIVLKGAHLLQHVYKKPALRAMGDIDLLVRRDDLKKSESVLVELGYHAHRKVLVDSSDPAWMHLPPMMKEGFLPVEIHWNIKEPDEDVDIAPEGLWDRAVGAEYAGAPAYGLCPEDLFLHLCFHAVYHHAFEAGLRDICDLDRVLIAHRDDLKWDAVIERAKKWRLQNTVWIALHFARSLLASPAPEEILAALKPKNVNDELMSWLGGQLFEQSDGYASKGFSGLVSERGFAGKMRALCSALFPTRKEMAGKYPVEETSLRIWMYYPLRWLYLIRRYFPKLRLVVAGDRRTEIQSENQAIRGRLQKWLQES